MTKTVSKNRRSFSTLYLEVLDRVATITLNRSERLNAITMAMPADIRAVVGAAN